MVADEFAQQTKKGLIYRNGFELFVARGSLRAFVVVVVAMCCDAIQLNKSMQDASNGRILWKLLKFTHTYWFPPKDDLILIQICTNRQANRGSAPSRKNYPAWSLGRSNHFGWYVILWARKTEEQLNRHDLSINGVVLLYAESVLGKWSIILDARISNWYMSPRNKMPQRVVVSSSAYIYLYGPFATCIHHRALLLWQLRTRQLQPVRAPNEECTNRWAAAAAARNGTSTKDSAHNSINIVYNYSLWPTTAVVVHPRWLPRMQMIIIVNFHSTRRSALPSLAQTDCGHRYNACIREDCTAASCT